MALKNPTRREQGGAVPGSEKIDQSLALPGQSIEVASASFDPGYDIDHTLECGYMTKADMKRGYSSYGVGIGEGSRTWRGLGEGNKTWKVYD